MSEVRNYKKISLGETETLFINIFSNPNSKGQYSYSAYQIFSILKEIKRPMAYKNVHKRVRRLHSLGLIKEVEKSQRNAIKYELTTRGLFERLLIPNRVDLSFLERNKKNVILQAILYRFFEEVTIHEFGEGMSYLPSYLRNCCYTILTLVNKQKPHLDDLDKRYLEWQADLRKNKLQPDFEMIYGSYTQKMEGLIMAQIRNFILVIVDFAKFEYLERNRQEEIRYKSPFPNELLKNDKKFIPILQEMKNSFDDGCKILLLENLSNLDLLR